MPNIFLQNDHCEAPEIPLLKPVLQSWIDAQRKYMKMTRTPPYDNPWDYGERGCIGFLAAGVWLSGGMALEEWKAGKGSESERWKGRADLWISLGDRREYEAHVEAKCEMFYTIANRANMLKAIETHLLRATYDASKHADADPEQQLGVLFVKPAFQQGDQDGMSERIATWLADVYSIGHSAIAWIFRERSELSAQNYLVCPGLVLIARTLKCQATTAAPPPNPVQ